jgi:hypothetical protein
MAEYKGIQGYSVEYLEADPPAAKAVGRLWYNDSGSGAFKIGTSAAGAWSSGGAMNTARYRGGGGGVGILTAGMVFGGYSTSAGAYLAQVEQYNGTSWTEGPMADYPSVTGDVGQCGTTTAAIGVCGNSTSPVNEVYVGNGSTWSAGENYPAAHERVGVAGLSTSAVAVGGASTATDGTWEYDGSTWTSGGNYTHSGSNIGISGIQTAAIAFDGYDPGVDGTEAATYNGSTWTAITATSTARGEFGWSTKGPTTDTMAFGTGNTEKWNGSSWTEIANVATSRTSGFSLGTTSASLYAGGNPGGVTTTEVWQDPVYTTKTVTVS